LGRTWSEDFGLSVLLVDFEPREVTGVEMAGHSRAARHGRRETGLVRLDASRTNSGDLKRMLEQAAARYHVVCVDLTHATAECSSVVLHRAHSIFLASDSDAASLEMTRDKMRQFRSLALQNRCTMLLRRVPGGLRPELAEDLAGAPVCGLVENSDQVTRLARWLAGPQPDLAAAIAV
jgi:hypothetical protein